MSVTAPVTLVRHVDGQFIGTINHIMCDHRYYDIPVMDRSAPTQYMDPRGYMDMPTIQRVVIEIEEIWLSEQLEYTSGTKKGGTIPHTVEDNYDVMRNRRIIYLGYKVAVVRKMSDLQHLPGLTYEDWAEDLTHQRAVGKAKPISNAARADLPPAARSEIVRLEQLVETTANKVEIEKSARLTVVAENKRLASNILTMNGTINEMIDNMTIATNFIEALVPLVHPAHIAPEVRDELIARDLVDAKHFEKTGAITSPQKPRLVDVT